MMQTWFEAKLRYLAVAESGLEKLVTESYLLDAVSFTEAESRMIEQARQMVRGEFAVKDIKQSNVDSVFLDSDGEFLYKAKINMVTIDEEAGREKRISIYYLVAGDNIEDAIKWLNKSMEYLVIPFEIVSVVKSAICDVFPYDISKHSSEMN